MCIIDMEDFFNWEDSFTEIKRKKDLFIFF